MADALSEKCGAGGVGERQTHVTLVANLKYDGADSTLPVPFGDVKALKDAFESEHKKRFGFTDPARTILVGSLTAEAMMEGDLKAPADTPSADAAAEESVVAAGPTEVRLAEGREYAALVYTRAALAPGLLRRPRAILENGATTYVAPGWRAEMNAHGDIVLTRAEKIERRHRRPRRSILLEVFNNRFMGVAEEMACAANHGLPRQHQGAADFYAVFDETAGLSPTHRTFR